MALYNIFVPGLEVSSESSVQNVASGMSAAPLVGTLFQGVTGTTQTTAVAAIITAIYNNTVTGEPEPFEQATHCYLQSNDLTV